MFKNMLKRSWLSTIRKPGRTIILVLILFVMANLLLATVAIKNSVDKSMNFAKEKLGATVYLSADTDKIRENLSQQQEGGISSVALSGPKISEDLVLDISDSEYIKNYTYSFQTSVNASGFEVVETSQNQREKQIQDALKNTQDQIQGQVNDFNSSRDQFNRQNRNSGGGGGREGIPGGGGGGGSFTMPNFSFNFNLDFSDPTLSRGDTTLLGINDFAYASGVEDGSLKIIEGETFNSESENQVLISKEVAETNELAVGSSIKLKAVDSDEETELAISGIYQSSTENFDHNTIYAGVATTKQFLSEEQLSELAVENVRFYLGSASEKDGFLTTTAEKLPEIAESNLKLDINDSSYQTMVGPIENVGKFATTMLWIVVIAAVVIITLIVVINVKDRRYEMGVLLSLGATRKNIIGQIFLELILVGTAGFMISTATSQFIAQKMGDSLLADQITISQEEQTNSQTNMRGAMDAFMRNGTLNNNTEVVEEISVAAGVNEYLTLFGMGYLILAVAMILPSVNILRYQPRTILAGKE
jgi:putative ABC transport system permease protein